MKITNPVGKKGEDIAVEYLKKKGYKILERNYRKQYAEIDIIGEKDQTVVFFEVKTRTSNKFGTPFEAITHWKLRPLIQLAEYYHMSDPTLPRAMRIDAISVMFHINGKATTEHLENIGGF